MEGPAEAAEEGICRKIRVDFVCHFKLLELRHSGSNGDSFSITSNRCIVRFNPISDLQCLPIASSAGAPMFWQ
ncbi:hypothetical protein V6N13_044593 [Hibiscus sabdariffa]